MRVQRALRPGAEARLRSTSFPAWRSAAFRVTWSKTRTLSRRDEQRVGFGTPFARRGRGRSSSLRVASNPIAPTRPPQNGIPDAAGARRGQPRARPATGRERLRRGARLRTAIGLASSEAPPRRRSRGIEYLPDALPFDAFEEESRAAAARASGNADTGVSRSAGMSNGALYHDAEASAQAKKAHLPRRRWAGWYRRIRAARPRRPPP